MLDTNPTAQLATIAVPGTQASMLATQFNGGTWVALKPLCESIGIDYKSQHEKLGRKSWATVVLSPTVAADGKNRDMVMIDRRTFTMWLATLDENRVNEAVKSTVIAFQAEAADALDSYFGHGGAIQTQPANQFDVLRAAIDQIEAAQRDAAEAKQLASATSARLDAIEGRHDWYAALGYARLIGHPNTSTKFLGQVGAQASKIARTHGITPVKVPHALFGTCNSYPAWVWELAFDGRES